MRQSSKPSEVPAPWNAGSMRELLEWSRGKGRCEGPAIEEVNPTDASPAVLNAYESCHTSAAALTLLLLLLLLDLYPLQQKQKQMQ